MALKDKPVLFVLPPVKTSDACARERFCLEAGMCMRHFFGWPHCVHTCEEDFVSELKTEVLSRLMADLISRVPVVEKKKALTLMKGLYFGA